MNDHIPDVTKMISDTPRTDKESFFPHDSKYKVCDSDFARQLERELNTANDSNREIRERNEWLNDKINAANDRIKRLEDSYAAKDQQLSNLLHICRANGIDVSSQDLIHGKEAKP